MGGKSDDSSSRAMVQMQKDEAATARNKEIQRQTRLDTGLANLKALFHGGQTKSTQSGNYTFSGPGAGAVGGGQVAGLPAGFTYAHTAGQAATPGTSGPLPQTVSQARGRTGSGNPDSMLYNGGTTNEMNQGNRRTSQNDGFGSAYSTGTAGTAATPGRAEKWQIRGPDGKLYDVGANVDYVGNTVTGSHAGIGDEFYNKFKQGILDYYDPQVKEKFGEAKDQLTYNTARAGQLRGSVANDELAKLVKQNDLRTGEVRSKADAAAADLRNRTAAEEAKAVAQLYATENPEVAANQATAAIRDITAETPDLTPLGAIFDVASIGGANYVQGARNAEYLKRIGALPKAGSADSIVS